MMGRSINGLFLSLVAFVSGLGCEPLAPEVSSGIDCAAENDVELGPAATTQQQDPEILVPFGLDWESAAALTATESELALGAEEPNFFCFADPSPNSYPTEAPWPSTAGCARPRVRAITENGVPAPFCQEGANAGTRHRSALNLRAGNHVYWGGQWGSWNMRNGNVRATIPRLDPTTGETVQLPADGIAFWAKKDMYSDSQLVVQLEDENVNVNGADAEGNRTCVKTITNPDKDDVQVAVTVKSSDPNVETSNTSASSVAYPAACGNRWNQVLELSNEWELHLLPFDEFYQELQPNRESAPFNPARIYQVAFVYNPGQTLSVWLDEMMLFRYKD